MFKNIKRKIQSRNYSKSISKKNLKYIPYFQYFHKYLFLNVNDKKTNLKKKSPAELVIILN